MRIDSVRALVFTGAGTTKVAARAFCEAFGAPFEVVDVTPRKRGIDAVRSGELLVCAVPSYGGRVPAPFLERLASIGRSGEAVPAVMLVTYGNRAVDDTFIELADALEAEGIVPVGGAAVVAHHSLMTNVAEGRPDADDLAVVGSLARRVRSELEAASRIEDAPLSRVQGRAVSSGRPGGSLRAMRRLRGFVPRRSDRPGASREHRCGTLHFLHALHRRMLARRAPDRRRVKARGCAQGVRAQVRPASRELSDLGRRAETKAPARSGYEGRVANPLHGARQRVGLKQGPASPRGCRTFDVRAGHAPAVARVFTGGRVRVRDYECFFTR